MKLTQEHYISNFSTRYVAEYGSIRYTALGRSRGGLTTKIHTVVASDRFAVNFSLSSGSANDRGMRLLSFTSPGKQKQYLLMDRAYSSKKMRIGAVDLGYVPIVPPKRNYKEQWEYDKLDIIFASFILFAMIIDSLV